MHVFRRMIPILLVLVMAATLTFADVTPTGAQSSYSDNFSANSGLWTYWGDAYRDAVNEYVVLTESQDGQGILWLNDELTAPFEAQFRYRIGGESESGADGLVFMFYKTKTYIPDYGGRLAFQEDSGNPVPGYGIEFDGYLNDYDPSDNHIALIKDLTSNHLAYVNDARTEDNMWHQVRIIVDSNKVVVEVDGGEVLTWQGAIDRTFGGMGFGAATGDDYNWHIIDDVRISTTITKASAVPTLSQWGIIGMTVVFALALVWFGRGRLAAKARG
jgi:hypothetical protein